MCQLVSQAMARHLASYPGLPSQLFIYRGKKHVTLPTLFSTSAKKAAREVAWARDRVRPRYVPRHNIFLA